MKAPSWAIRRRKLLWGGLLGALLMAVLWWAVGPLYIGVPRVPVIDTRPWAEKTEQLYLATAAGSSTIYIAAELKEGIGKNIVDLRAAPIMTMATLPIVEYDLLTGTSKTLPPEMWATLDPSFSKMKVINAGWDSDVPPKLPQWNSSADGLALFVGARPSPATGRPYEPSQADLLKAGAKRVPLTGAVPLWTGMAFTPDYKTVCVLSAARFYRRSGGLFGEGPTREYVGPMTVNFANSFTGEVAPNSFVLAGSRNEAYLQTLWSSDGRFALIMEQSCFCLWIIDTSNLELPPGKVR